MFTNTHDYYYIHATNGFTKSFWAVSDQAARMQSSRWIKDANVDILLYQKTFTHPEMKLISWRKPKKNNLHTKWVKK